MPFRNDLVFIKNFLDFMRFSTFAIAATCLVGNAVAVTDCSDIAADDTWYIELVGAGIGAAALGTATALKTALPGTDIEELNAHLDNGDACAAALLTFATSVRAVKTTDSANVANDCDATKTASACVARMQTHINTLNGNDAMRSRSILTGLSTIECTSTEWTDLTYEFRSVVPIYVAAKYAASSLAAGTVIADDANLADLDTAITGITCEECLNYLAADLYFLYNDDGTLEAACANPYTSGCETALGGPLTAFGSCSGQVLNRGATRTCTDTQFAALVNVDVADSILAASVDSTSAVALSTALTALYESITFENLAAPCWTCFTELAHAVFNLDEVDLAICADIESADCADIIGDYIAGFEDCSGSPFALKAITTSEPTITTATTTTSSVTTTAAVTATATGTTTATTTKSSMFTVISGGLAALIFIVAL